MKRKYVKPEAEELLCGMDVFLCASTNEEKPKGGLDWGNGNESDISGDDEESGGPV